jgi:fused signal recognition particle receptor
MFGIGKKVKNLFSKTEEVIEEEPKNIDESLPPPPEFQNEKKEEEAIDIEESSKAQKLKNPKNEAEDHKSVDLPPPPEFENKPEEETKGEKKEGILSRTFGGLVKKTISEDNFEKIWVELEIFLLEINIAFEIVDKIKENMQSSLIGNKFDRFSLNRKIRAILEEEVENVLKDREAKFLEKLSEYEKPAKILILGVNGTGKTTSIAKIVHYLQKNNLKTVVAAADTFRAAAVEQLEEHSQKLNFKLIKHKGGSDPAAVAYDAIEHAKAKELDVVLIDTAGRMPNNSNLIMELQKVKKVSKTDFVIFIGDSISGNDLIEQINLFDQALGIDGVILTKVDTDERPGSIVTTAYSIEKPIYFLGCGQTYDDLVEFNSKEIAQKLFDIEDE